MQSRKHIVSERAKIQDRLEKLVIKKIRRILRHVNPIKSAAAFCGMATCGSLHSNQIRIANLTHASLKLAGGKEKLKKHQINILFNLMGETTVGRDEDPAEDVYISTVCSKGKSYLIYEGNWEGSSFTLERFVDIVDGMPDTGNFGETKKSVHALLKVSDIIAKRSREEVNVVTCQFPKKKLPANILVEPAILCEKVRVSTSELLSHGIDPSSLNPFIFDISRGPELPLPAHRSLTLLDKHPILLDDAGDYFLFPPGVSTAVRYFILSRYATSGAGREALAANLLESHREILTKYEFLGALPSPLANAQPTHIGDFLILESLATAPGGRPIHCIFVFDLFNGNIKEWFTPLFVNFEDDLSLSKRIEKAKNATSQQDGTKDGISLLILTGWGRSLEITHDFMDTEDWSLRIVTLHDLCQLSDYPSMKPLHLWRIIRAEKGLASHKGKIFNMNGMLNLFGWLVKNDWHMVPHENLPKADLSASGLMIQIPTNMIANIRERSRRARDRKKLPDIDGNEKYVMRYEGSSYFQEDDGLPLYGCIETVTSGKLAAAYIGKYSLWWCRVKTPKKRDLDFHIWESATRWLSRIDQAVNDNGLQLPEILDWQLEILIQENDIPPNEQFSSTSLQNGQQILTTIKVSSNTLFGEPDNSGEREMVLSFLHELLHTEEFIEIENLIQHIFPKKDAKYCHCLQARTFNDYIADTLPRPILIEQADDAYLRLGLGWLEGEEGKFQKILGIEACTNRINQICDRLWKKISGELEKFDRKLLCQKLLLNIEAIRTESQSWERTVRANIALHENADNVFEVITQQIGRFSAANLGSRILIEMAVCSCPLGKGEKPDELEVSILLGAAMLLFHLGSWSDAIRSGLYPPEIHISAFGQVMMNYEFEKKVMNPYQSMFGRQQRITEAEKYDKLYENYVEKKSSEEVFPASYLEAWEDEYHVSVDNIRKSIDLLEDFGISRNEAVYIKKRSDLIALIRESINDVSVLDAKYFLTKISLPSRSKWDQPKSMLPEHIEPQDWYPWNFRRKLSLVFRPILELDSNDDPSLLVSPGALRDSFIYLMSNSF